MDIELFDLILEARKHDDAIYNEDGSLKYMRNIQDIFREFAFAEGTIKELSFIINSKDTIYKNMIKSYELHTEFMETERIGYVLGMTYTMEMESREEKGIDSKSELDSLVNKRWKNFQKYVKKKNLPKKLIDSHSFHGILDQTRIDYGYMNRKL